MRGISGGLFCAALLACAPGARPAAAPDAGAKDLADAAAPPASSAPDAGPLGDASAPAGLDADRLAAALDRVRLEQHAVGAALGVRIAAGSWLGAAGKRSPSGTPLEPGDRFQIGSVSKTFIATLVLLEVDAGRVSLDAPIAPWWPALPSADRITIRNLLQHTSGLPDYLANPTLDPTRPATPRTLLAWVASQPLAFQPGDHHDYSNSNYIALGVILEELAGQPLTRQIADRITTPLGLTATALHEAGTEAPAGFWYENNTWVADPQEHASVAWAAGAVISTPADLLVFFQALLGGTLLPAARLTDMQTGVPIPESNGAAFYGLGLMWEDTPLGRLYFHGGLIDNTLTMAGGLADGRLYLAGYFNTIPTADRALVTTALTALP